jgi:hypothetical protein
MEPIVVLIIVLIAVALAWKLLKGIAKTAVLAVILVIGAALVFGGFN